MGVTCVTFTGSTGKTSCLPSAKAYKPSHQAAGAAVASAALLHSKSWANASHWPFLYSEESGKRLQASTLRLEDTKKDSDKGEHLSSQPGLRHGLKLRPKHLFLLVMPTYLCALESLGTEGS